MAPKRKTPPTLAASANKKKPSNGDEAGFDHSRATEKYGIVQRGFYPKEMSNERCSQYANNEIPSPYAELLEKMSSTSEARAKIAVEGAVVHWFKRDLRLHDNRALWQASEKAKSKGVPLICMYIISPQDFQAHVTSAVRVDFELRTLKVIKDDLAKLDIPLYVETQDKRKAIPGRIIELCKEWNASHIYCNIEYEVDELRREKVLIDKCLEAGIASTPVHDDAIVQPGDLSSGTGNQYSVYSPWYRAWVAHLHKHEELLKLAEPPAKNPSSARKHFKSIFDHEIPKAPANKSLSEEAQKRYSSLWPAGEHEAQERLQKFLSDKVKKYKDARNLPAANLTSVLSVHFATGTLSARSAVRAARESNSSKKLDGGNAGITVWISEVGWRDFYKHVLARWPFVCMNKSFKYEYSDIEWEYDDEKFELWCSGRTGYPIVDAAMRQLNYTGYMHNRCRMIVASFLAKDLLIDWRMGEKYFMEQLIDGDFASNNGGWGFSASTGVDPQPYFRIFNPLLQSEKFDAEGEYIRKWVPELKDIKGKAIHDPYGRGADSTAKKNGYPKPCIDHKFARNRALDRYKTGLGRSTA